MLSTVQYIFFLIYIVTMGDHDFQVFIKAEFLMVRFWCADIKRGACLLSVPPMKPEQKDVIPFRKECVPKSSILKPRVAVIAVSASLSHSVNALYGIPTKSLSFLLISSVSRKPKAKTCKARARIGQISGRYGLA